MLSFDPSIMAESRDYVSDFGRLVRQLRTDRGWTQRELAVRAHLTETTVSNIERGSTRRITTDTADGLATAFEVTPELLDPRRLGDAVAEEATTIDRRAAIRSILEVAPEDLPLVFEAIEGLKKKRRHRGKARRP
jgi:transcriptional regulator with XRE-family HTH domain